MNLAHTSHKLQLSTISGSRQPVLWCSKCGRYSSGRKAGITKPCSQIKTSNYKELQRGIHPASKLPISKPVRVLTRQPAIEASTSKHTPRHKDQNRRDWEALCEEDRQESRDALEWLEAEEWPSEPGWFESNEVRYL